MDLRVVGTGILFVSISAWVLAFALDGVPYTTFVKPQEEAQEEFRVHQIIWGCFIALGLMLLMIGIFRSG